MAKIALFGANGTIGSRVLREALDRGHHVTAVVREITESHPHLTVVQGNVLDPASVTAVAKGQDVVVSAVGGGDGPGHLATIEPSAQSLIAGLRAVDGDPPRLITVGGAAGRDRQQRFDQRPLEPVQRLADREQLLARGDLLTAAPLTHRLDL